jgi:hypothetical protein
MAARPPVARAPEARVKGPADKASRSGSASLNGHPKPLNFSPFPPMLTRRAADEPTSAL